MAPIPMNAADATMGAQFGALSLSSFSGPKYPSAPRTKNSVGGVQIHSYSTMQCVALNVGGGRQNNGTGKASLGGPTGSAEIIAAGRKTNSYIEV